MLLTTKSLNARTTPETDLEYHTGRALDLILINPGLTLQERSELELMFSDMTTIEWKRIEQYFDRTKISDDNDESADLFLTEQAVAKFEYLDWLLTEATELLKERFDAALSPIEKDDSKLEDIMFEIGV